jgi:hypothetical protein
VHSPKPSFQLPTILPSPEFEDATIAIGAKTEHKCDERALLEQAGLAFDDANAWLAAAPELRDDFHSDIAVCWSWC